MHPIFRSEAIHAHRGAPLGAVVLVRPLSFTVYCIAAMAMLLALSAFVLLGSYTRRVTVMGQLQVEGGVVRVKSPAAGLIVERFVREGAAVEKEQPLYAVSTERTTATFGETQAATIRQLETKLRNVGTEINQLTRFYAQESARAQRDLISYQREIAALSQQIVAQKEQLSISGEALARHGSLVRDGFLSPEAIRTKEADVAEQRARVAALERELVALRRSLQGREDDLAGLPIRHGREVDTLEKARADLAIALNEQEAKRRLLITAPRSGIATATVGEVGQSVVADGPLLTIVPAMRRFQATLFANSRALGLLKVGDGLMLNHQAYPHEKYGMSEGRLTSISDAPMTASEVAQSMPGAELQLVATDGPYYVLTVDVTMVPADIDGKAFSYRSGMVVEASIAVERKRFYQWLFEPVETAWRRSGIAQANATRGNG